MLLDLPGSESQTPDGVPLGWAAPWEKPQMMVVEEREGMFQTRSIVGVRPFPWFLIRRFVTIGCDYCRVLITNKNFQFCEYAGQIQF